MRLPYTSLVLSIFLACSGTAWAQIEPGEEAGAPVEPQVDPIDAAAEEPTAPATVLSDTETGPATELPEEGDDPEAAGPETKLEALQVVHRGFYMGFNTGLGILAKREADVRYYPGADVGITMGYDFGELVSVQALLFFNAYGNFKGEEERDLAVMGARLALLFTPWHTERSYLQAGLGGGIAYTDDGFDSQFDQRIAANILVGYEYYTDLRHFSVGVDLDCQLLLNPFNANIQLLPHVRYTF